MQVQFEKVYRDRITGFAGVCAGKCEYVSGCNQVLLIPAMKEDSNEMPKAVWIDEDRLIDEETGQAVLTPELAAAAPGGPQGNEAPIR